MGKLILKPGREKSLKRRHPWVFSGAVAKLQGEPGAGDTVEVHSATGEFLALAAYSPQSQIVARVWDWKKRAIDGAFFEERVKRALEQRRALLETGAAGALRLVHGESDGLPGVVADRYGDTVVVQLTSAGAERWRETIADALLQAGGVRRIWERSDAEVRALEGLAPVTAALRGAREPTRITVAENGLEFGVDLEHGHKTGFYLDQRDNRRRARTLARERDVLDGFCYSGGFALNALAGGARSVTAMDSSADALGLARENAERNRLAGVNWIEGDVFQRLRKFRDEGKRFDLVVLDPPKFAPTATHAPKAARAYKDINLLAFKLLRPGGLLMTFSCSGGVSPDLFQKIVAGAALDAGVDAQIIERLGPGADHPVALNFPEGDYLKGLVCRVPG
ncbi:MAG: 23S rRNA methyltransferase [Betaproteobacteria bacterium RIFCSPLOWO2_02_FULL_67_26]|nr:MAG: 23S rRNA methyltransferase [Betaproteobacteria bacterium RIFCSPLOWO2_02_FULL_67_26]